ncbi:MAG: hypothetical protein ABIM98_07425 [candidate division WOR-3 bacterium]
MKEKLVSLILALVGEEWRKNRRGFNPVWSGLNNFIRSKGFEPTQIYEELSQKGLIKIRPMKISKNGKEYKFVLLYPPEASFSQIDFEALLQQVSKNKKR